MKHATKKLFLLALIFCNLSFTVFANRTDSKLEEAIINNMPEDFWYMISEKSLSDNELEEAWYKERIPAKYADAFLYYTRTKPEMRMNFYSLMVHESSNFTAFVHKNYDGSYDYGPSQLNSKNLNNKTFQKYYRPTDESHITNKYCFYMVETINFYWDLYNKVGEDYAFFAYNGGERAADWKKRGINPNSSLIKNVTAYDKAVRSNVEKHTKELASYKEEARSSHIAELKREFSDLGLYVAFNKYYDNIYSDFETFQARYRQIKLDLKNQASVDTIITIYILSQSHLAYIKREDSLLYEFS